MVLNKKKMAVGLKTATYVGHRFTQHDVQCDPNKVASISQKPRPQDRDAVSRLLGMVTYLGKFIPHLSHVTALLRQVISKVLSSIRYENKAIHSRQFVML